MVDSNVIGDKSARGNFRRGPSGSNEALAAAEDDVEEKESTSITGVHFQRARIEIAAVRTQHSAVITVRASNAGRRIYGDAVAQVGTPRKAAVVSNRSGTSRNACAGGLESRAAHTSEKRSAIFRPRKQLSNIRPPSVRVVQHTRPFPC